MKTQSTESAGVCIVPTEENEKKHLENVGNAFIHFGTRVVCNSVVLPVADVENKTGMVQKFVIKIEI